MTSAPGKLVARRRYVHVDAGAPLSPELEALLARAESFAERRRGRDFNLARFDRDEGTVALLSYPGFFDDPFPTLAASWLVDLGAGTVGYRTYADSLNPPILHRKELLLPAEHPQRDAFAALTAACESIGLFDEPTRIGYRRQWLALVREKGYRIEGHALVPLGNDESGPAAEEAPGRCMPVGRPRDTSRRWCVTASRRRSSRWRGMGFWTAATGCSTMAAGAATTCGGWSRTV
jgi:hypothetical protein